MQNNKQCIHVGINIGTTFIQCQRIGNTLYYQHDLYAKLPVTKIRNINMLENIYTKIHPK